MTSAAAASAGMIVKEQRANRFEESSTTALDSLPVSTAFNAPGAAPGAPRRAPERFDAALPISCPIPDIREATGRSRPMPKDLLDRRVEITGPVDRKMVVNALNSGAMMFMADFEDASSPTWQT